MTAHRVSTTSGMTSQDDQCIHILPKKMPDGSFSKNTHYSNILSEPQVLRVGGHHSRDAAVR
jgi:hypothetical protein